jgi:hypothetical protein
MRPTIRIAIASTLCFLPAALNAALVIDNIGNGSNAFSSTLSGPTATGFFFPTPFENREIAFSFTTGTTETYLESLSMVMNIGKGILDPIQIALSTGASAPGGTGTVTLGSATPVGSPANQTLTFMPTVPPVLQPSTLYWLHITVPSGAAVYSVPSSDGAVLASGWSLGTTWTKTPSTAWTEGNSILGGDIRLNASPVPEPGTAMLGSIGMLLLIRRRR